MEKQELFFEVNAIPVSTLIPNLETKSGISQAIVGHGEILAFTSLDYSLIKNRVIFDSVSSFLKNLGLPFTFTYKTWGYARFEMAFFIKGFEKAVQVGDLLGPEIRIQNSYDRSLSYRVSYGIQRLICSNGLTVLESDSHWNKLHTSAIGDGVAEQLTVDGVTKLLDNFEGILDPLFELQSIPVINIPLRIEEVVKETSYPISLTDKALERIQFEILNYGVKQTDFLVYNGLNYALGNFAEHLLGRKAHKIDREVLTYLITN